VQKEEETDIQNPRDCDDQDYRRPGIDPLPTATCLAASDLYGLAMIEDGSELNV
jgi:hypothetical protein